MINIETYRALATNAYRGTSFFPEDRATHDLKELEEHLKDVKTEIFGSLLTDDKKNSLYSWYETKLIKLQTALWATKGRCLSTMITGASNFPVKRAKKASEAADKRTDELLEHWNIDISKLIKKNLSDDIKQNEVDAEEKAFIDRKIESILAIRNGRIGYDISLFKSALQGKVERLIKNKNLATAEYALDKIKQENIFTEKNKIFKLFADAKAINKDAEPKQSSEYQINGIKVLENTDADRFQILFDGKPEQDIINALKSSGWRWSPFFKAWQRKLTPNARYSAEHILGGLS